MKLNLVFASSIMSLAMMIAPCAQEAQSTQEQRIKRLEEDLTALAARVTELERNQNILQHYALGAYYEDKAPPNDQAIAFCKAHGYAGLLSVFVSPKQEVTMVCVNPLPQASTAPQLNR